MAARKDDDEDYWNESDTKGFNFEEDEFGNQLFGVSKIGTARLSQQVRAGLGEDIAAPRGDTDTLSSTFEKASFGCMQETPVKPLSAMLSEKSLKLILEGNEPRLKGIKGPVSVEEEVRVLRRKVEEQWVPLPAKETVTKILLGQPYTLELYRSLKSKEELLEAAVALGDGNAILAVVLFLSKTLKKSLVYQLLRKHPEAVSQYAHFLTVRCQVQEVTDLLEMMGESREAAMKQFHFAVRVTKNPQRQLQKLQACLINHFSNMKDKQIIENYVKLLDWQLNVAGKDGELCKILLGQPVVASLAYTCENHWGEPKNSVTSPHYLCQLQNICDRQFQWTVLNTRASVQAWDDIESIFITKNWLGGRKAKAVLPMEVIAQTLSARGAPYEVVVKYLQMIDNLERRKTIAIKLKCHKAVIDIFVSLRDRQGLIGYKATLHPQSEDYFYAENALRATTQKWKN